MRTVSRHISTMRDGVFSYRNNQDAASSAAMLNRMIQVVILGMEIGMWRDNTIGGDTCSASAVPMQKQQTGSG